MRALRWADRLPIARETIISLLSQGHSHNEVARRTCRSQTAVSDLARTRGIAAVNRMPKAQAAAREHNKLKRANLLNLALNRVQTLLIREDITAREMKDLVMALPSLWMNAAWRTAKRARQASNVPAVF